MPRLPSFKPREIEKILLKNGFFLKRQAGSHRIFYNPKTERLVVVPFHSREIPRGTLKSIIRQSDLPEEKFLRRERRGR